MEKNRIIIIALIVIIVALLVGLAAMMVPNMGKQDSKLTFKGNSTLVQGDSLKIKLTDANGTAIANRTVNVSITNTEGTDGYHSVVTNAKGVGTLKSDNDAGKYDVTIMYGGNDNYNGCNATKKITIEEKVVEATVEHVNSKDSSNNVQNDDSSGQTSDNNMPEEIRKVYAARQKAADDGIPMYEYTSSPELVEKYQAMV